MQKADLFECVLRAAKEVQRFEWLVIGSQAIHGTFPDPDMDVVIRSVDADVVALEYEEWMFLPMHTELGADSDFHEERGYYVEIVRPTLPRFPANWRDRLNREDLGTAEINGVSHVVVAYFPEIHDLTASKVIVGRAKDLEFLDGVIKLRLISEEVLKERLASTEERKAGEAERALEAVTKAFERAREIESNL